MKINTNVNNFKDNICKEIQENRVGLFRISKEFFNSIKMDVWNKIFKDCKIKSIYYENPLGLKCKYFKEAVVICYKMYSKIFKSVTDYDHIPEYRAIIFKEKIDRNGNFGIEKIIWEMFDEEKAKWVKV